MGNLYLTGHIPFQLNEKNYSEEQDETGERKFADRNFSDCHVM